MRLEALLKTGCRDGPAIAADNLLSATACLELHNMSSPTPQYRTLQAVLHGPEGRQTAQSQQHTRRSNRYELQACGSLAALGFDMDWLSLFSVRPWRLRTVVQQRIVHPQPCGCLTTHASYGHRSCRGLPGGLRAGRCLAQPCCPRGKLEGLQQHEDCQGYIQVIAGKS